MNQTLTRDDWQAMADALTIRHQAFIDGKYVDAASGRTFDALSPIDGRVLAKVAECEAEDIDRAVAAARRSFESGIWSEAKPAQRKRTLIRFAQLIDTYGRELALLESLDMGKPVADALAVDVAASVRCMNWTGEAIDKVYGEIASTGPDELGLVTREPLGVVGAIVPWNFPMLMAVWKLAPALAMGNSVVLKPSEKSPLTAIRLAEIAIEAGIPPGVFNVVPGLGRAAGEPLARHMDVDGLVFTGSTAVGKFLLTCAGESNMKRAYMECGGKSPNIVFADAHDLHRAGLDGRDRRHDDGLGRGLVDVDAVALRPAHRARLHDHRIRAVVAHDDRGAGRSRSEVDPDRVDLERPGTGDTRPAGEQQRQRDGQRRGERAASCVGHCSHRRRRVAIRS